MNSQMKENGNPITRKKTLTEHCEENNIIRHTKTNTHEENREAVDGVKKCSNRGTGTTRQRKPRKKRHKKQNEDH